MEEAYEVFREAKTGKVSGISGTTVEHFRNLPRDLMEYVMVMINDMLDGNFPEAEQMGVVCPIPKDHKRIRPIILLRTLFRAVDGLFNRRFLIYITKQQTMRTKQFGSVKGGCTSNAFNLLLTAIEDARINDKECWITLLDASEALTH